MILLKAILILFLRYIAPSQPPSARDGIVTVGFTKSFVQTHKLDTADKAKHLLYVLL